MNVYRIETLVTSYVGGKYCGIDKDTFKVVAKDFDSACKKAIAIGKKTNKSGRASKNDPLVEYKNHRISSCELIVDDVSI